MSSLAAANEPSKKRVVTTLVSPANSGVARRKATTKAGAAPRSFRDLATGKTPHEQIGLGAPIKAPFAA